MMKLIKKKVSSNSFTGIAFVFSLIAISLIYNYHHIAFFRPQSTHQWRQADCASIVKNYYQNGMNLFRPEVHNLTSEKGTSGKAYTSEIPAYYYCISAFYHIFGPNESIFRIFNTLLFLLGLFYLHKLFLLIIKNQFWSIVLPLFFFTAPVLVYYGNSFISNPLALSFSIVGLYYFARFAIQKNFKHFIFFILIFLLASSLKITAFFSFFAIGAYALFDIFGSKFIKGQPKIFKKPFLSLALFTLPVIIVGLWVVYAHAQNTKNECFYFSTVTFPIWSLQLTEIKNVLYQIRDIWLNQYFHFSMFVLIIAEFVFVAVNFKKLPVFMKVTLPVLVAEAIVFILLQFWTFKDHDYYTIGLYIVPIVFTLTSIFLLKNHYSKTYNSIIFKAAILVLLIYNIYYAKGQLHNRYNGWWNNVKNYEELHDIEPYLRQIGIKQTDTVISIPDHSNASLYLMNQKGWTEFTDYGFNKGEKIYYNSDSAGIQESINKGAKYLVLNGIDQLYKKPYIVPFCHYKTGQHKGVFIFNLQSSDTNFNLNNKVLKTSWFCNADTLTSDGKYFKSGEKLFEYGKTQTNATSVSGDYSCELNNENPYGMTIKTKNLMLGDIFTITIWCKNSLNSEGTIVAKLNGANLIDDIETIQEVNGWKQYETTIFIENIQPNSELVIFAYNTNGNAFFDDLEIEQHSIDIR